MTHTRQSSLAASSTQDKQALSRDQLLTLQNRIFRQLRDDRGKIIRDDKTSDKTYSISFIDGILSITKESFFPIREETRTQLLSSIKLLPEVEKAKDPFRYESSKESELDHTFKIIFSKEVSQSFVAIVLSEKSNKPSERAPTYNNQSLGSAQPATSAKEKVLEDKETHHKSQIPKSAQEDKLPWHVRVENKKFKGNQLFAAQQSVVTKDISVEGDMTTICAPSESIGEQVKTYLNLELKEITDLIDLIKIIIVQTVFPAYDFSTQLQLELGKNCECTAYKPDKDGQVRVSGNSNNSFFKFSLNMQREKSHELKNELLEVISNPSRIRVISSARY